MKNCPPFPLAITSLVAMTFIVTACSKPVEPVAVAPAVVPATAPQATTTDSNVADVDVNTNVKTALLQDPTLQRFDINVETTKGDVRMTGVLENQAQIDDAVRIARAANGVHGIHDELTIRK
jgi:hyperosmotically inducible protein